jgi:regulator of sigma E protease
MLTVAATIFVLGVLIFVHELGHFLAAKAAGIAVPRFSIGFGPPTPLKFRRGETEYLISWIPFGGYVKMASLEEQEAMASLEGGGLEEEFPPDRLFESKPLGARIVVLAAGVIMNALFAWVVFSGLLIAYGQAVLKPSVGALVADAPAARAGLEAGDLITRIDGQPIGSWEALVAAVEGRAGEPLLFAIDRGGETIEIEVTPADEAATDPVTGEVRRVGRIGIQPGGDFDRIELGFTAAIAEGTRQTWDNGRQVLGFLEGLIFGRVSVRELGGPILIGKVSGQVARAGFEPLLLFMAFLSINLAILNLLPIPVLDGGHLIFLLLEGLRGKPLPQNLRHRLTQAGMFVLLGIMLFAVVNDVFRIAGG